MTVLWWIRRHSRNFKPFVANRIAEIQNVTEPSQLRFLATTENVADHATRGLTVTALTDCNEWWHGPKFLSEPASSWPKTKLDPGDKKDCEMKRQTTKLKSNRTYLGDVVVSEQTADVWRLNPERFSKWLRLLRVRAWVLRFVHNCRLLPDQRIRCNSLTVDDIADQETAVIVEAQKIAYRKEYALLLTKKELPCKSELLSLNPRVDDVGLLRCNSRLQFAEQLPYRTRFPIILPKKSAVTKLIISHCDALSNHAHGINHIFANLQEKFWIVKGREAVREWKSSCNCCIRKNARPAQEIMAPLPNAKMQVSRTIESFC